MESLRLCGTRELGASRAVLHRERSVDGRGSNSAVAVRFQPHAAPRARRPAAGRFPAPDGGRRSTTRAGRTKPSSSAARRHAQHAATTPSSLARTSASKSGSTSMTNGPQRTRSERSPLVEVDTLETRSTTRSGLALGERSPARRSRFSRQACSDRPSMPCRRAHAASPRPLTSAASRQATASSSSRSFRPAILTSEPERHRITKVSPPSLADGSSFTIKQFRYRKLTARRWDEGTFHLASSAQRDNLANPLGSCPR